MWRIFCAMRTETRRVQSAVLRSVRPMVDPLVVSKWPRDRRALDRMIEKCGSFNSRILRVVYIDMKDVGLDVVKFTFVDPIYAWAATALRVSRCWPLYFQFCPLYDPNTHERLYGTSVRCGQVMEKSCARVQSMPVYDTTLRRGPALFGISWDAGQASKRRSYTPIIISVGNTDSASSDTCVCIGYLPTLNTSDSDVRRVLVQRCIGSILKILNANSERGFTCILADEQGLECKWHLYPVLARVEVDTKERYKFFGCSRQRACGIGSGPRRGRSALRRCRSHSQR